MPRSPIGRTVLHIGTEKTGSTSIQAHLSANRDALAERGILVPTSGSTENNGWHMGIAAAFCDFQNLRDMGARYSLHSPSDQREFRERLVARIEREIADVAPHTVVFSSEHLHSRITSAESAKQLAKWARGLSTTVDVAVYLTRQDRLAISKASTALRGGYQDLDTVFVQPVDASGKLASFYDYHALWSRYRSAFGPSSIRLRTLGRAAPAVTDVVVDFFQMLGVDPESIERLTPSNTGLKLSRAGLEAFVSIVNRFGRVAGDFAGWNLFEQLREIAPGGGFRELVTVDEARAFVSPFEPGNREIARSSGLGDRLFDDDFSEYAHDPPHDESATFDVIMEALGRLGTESAALRRSIQISGELPSPLRESLVREPLPVLQVESPVTITSRELAEHLAFDDAWTPGEDGQTAVIEPGSSARAWMLVANPRLPRPVHVDVDMAGAELTTVQLTGRRGTVSVEAGSATVQAVSGISIVRLDVRVDDASESAHVVLRSLRLGWESA